MFAFDLIAYSFLSAVGMLKVVLGPWASGVRSLSRFEPGSSSRVPTEIIDMNGVTIRPDPAGPSIFSAIQEQLGLKLETTEAPVELLVIDHVEQPSAN